MRKFHFQKIGTRMPQEEILQSIQFMLILMGIYLILLTVKKILKMAKLILLEILKKELKKIILGY